MNFIDCASALRPVIAVSGINEWSLPVQLLSNIRRGLPAILGCAALVIAWIAWHWVAERNLNPNTEEPGGAPLEARTEIELTEEKIGLAEITCETIEPKTGRLSVVVPGRLAYDEWHRVSVRLATAGMLTSILVKPGDQVVAGQVLAMMSSPEVGTARADERQRAAELELALRQSKWDESRASGIQKLVHAIQSGKSPSEIREKYGDETLGTALDNLMTAYSSQLQAQSLVTRIGDAAQSGALPGRTVDERQRSAEVSRTALRSMIEQTTYDAARASLASKVALDDARRRWEIAAGRVATLLGQSPPPESTASDASGAKAATGDLSIVEIRASASGTVEQKLFNENERVEAGNVLFVLADTSRLWLKADLRESQWSALALKAGQEVIVTSPALPDEEMKATIVMMGREVDPQTNAISLVASVDNGYGRLKPGLYVRTQLPLGDTTSQIIIPEAAVATHVGQTFVFETSDDRKFVRRDIRLGKAQDGWVEVIAGLSTGQRIAVSGVFVLKSELLLESEE